MGDAISVTGERRGKKKFHENSFSFLYKVVVVKSEVRNNKGWAVGSGKGRLLLWG